jgi:toxic protein SymE
MRAAIRIMHASALTLKGQWLEAAGFATGTEVEARIMNGCIVLTAKEPEPELLASLRVVEKLSARKQKQVREFIGVVSGKSGRANGLR